MYAGIVAAFGTLAAVKGLLPSRVLLLRTVPAGHLPARPDPVEVWQVMLMHLQPSIACLSKATRSCEGATAGPSLQLTKRFEHWRPALGAVKLAAALPEEGEQLSQSGSL